MASLTFTLIPASVVGKGKTAADCVELLNCEPKAVTVESGASIAPLKLAAKTLTIAGGGGAPSPSLSKKPAPSLGDADQKIRKRHF